MDSVSRGSLPGLLGPKWPLQLHSQLSTLSAALPAIHAKRWHAGPIKAGCDREHQGRFGLVQRERHLSREARRKRGTSAVRRGTGAPQPQGEAQKCGAPQAKRARHNQVGYLGELTEPEARSSLAPLSVSENGRNTPFTAGGCRDSRALQVSGQKGSRSAARCTKLTSKTVPFDNIGPSGQGFRSRSSSSLLCVLRSGRPMPRIDYIGVRGRDSGAAARLAYSAFCVWGGLSPE